MSHSSKPKSTAIRFLFENSLFLIAGAAAALVWANLDAESYHHFIHFDVGAALLSGEHEDGEHQGGEHQGGEHQGSEHQDGEHSQGGQLAAAVDPAESEAAAPEHHGGITFHFLVNDVLMALFFAIAGKEVWESLLPGGALSNPRKAATPLLATLGGVVGPAAIYLAGAAIMGRWDLSRGWAIPCATDIAFSYLVARLVFGQGHPAIAFLLLLAIADDAIGLIILAVAYPSKPIVAKWLLLAVGAVVLGYLLRQLRAHSFWWYLLFPGALCWFAFYKAGLHPALGLVPIIPAIPHAHTDLGIFAREELKRNDTLNEFEHWWKNPVELVLGLFGLVNAGVEFNAVGVGTWIVLLGLLVGKPLGITLFTWISEKLFKLEVPAGMSYRHIFTLGMIAAIGFTVALFVSTAAFKVPPFPSAVQDSVKMGALMSLLAAVLAFAIARMLGIKPLRITRKESQDSAPTSH